jgi:Domain of unknown function (DUF4365)
LTLNDLKAEFSHAYMRAVAHAAGYFLQEANRVFDGEGVDLTLLARASGGIVRSPRLDLQLKATAAAVTEAPFPFDLEVKNVLGTFRGKGVRGYYAILESSWLIQSKNTHEYWSARARTMTESPALESKFAGTQPGLLSVTDATPPTSEAL